MKKNSAWKTLLFKVSYLDLELQDRKVLIAQNRIEFDQLVSKEVGPDFYKKKYGEPSTNGLVLSPEESGIEETESEASCKDASTNTINSPDIIEREEKVPGSINKLWKLIALKTHPDRNGINEYLTQMYIAAEGPSFTGK